jgi:hypothetical protein
MNNAFLDLYHKHVAAIFDRQLRFNDFLQANGDGGDWGYDVPSGVLTFGDTLQFDAPLLGSFAENNASWLWAWANRHIERPDSNRSLADRVRALAGPVFTAEHSVPCGDHLPEDVFDVIPHVFGIVAAGELAFDAYYLMPYEGGCGVVVVKDERLRFAEPHPARRIASIFPQAIDVFAIHNHRAAFIAYAESYGLTASMAIPCVAVQKDGVEVMKAEFDQRDRLVNLEAHTGPKSDHG